MSHSITDLASPSRKPLRNCFSPCSGNERILVSTERITSLIFPLSCAKLVIAEIGCVEAYVQALINSGELKVEGKISFPFHEERRSRPPKTDFLSWIVDSEGYHFGRIVCLDDEIIGVLLCYTKSRGRSIAFLSNIAVASQNRRRGVGSALMRKLIDFYGPQREIEAIELNVGITNAVAIKFYLENGFRTKEIRDYSGYTMEYRLRPGC